MFTMPHRGSIPAGWARSCLSRWEYTFILSNFIILLNYKIAAVPLPGGLARVGVGGVERAGGLHGQEGGAPPGPIHPVRPSPPHTLTTHTHTHTHTLTTHAHTHPIILQ